MSFDSASASELEEVCLVIPLFNEAQVISEVITEARQTFPNIVCVDDGSRDDSANLAAQAGATVLRHPINLGQGASLQTGFDYVLTYTSARYVATFDADGQHQVADVLNMLRLAKEKDLAVVFGSRFLAEKVEAGWLKRVVLKLAAWATARTTKMQLTDAHNGLRLLRRDALAKISLKQNRMAHASEIVAQVRDTGLPWAEAPVHIRYTEYSKAKGQSLWNSVNILADLIMN